MKLYLINIKLKTVGSLSCFLKNLIKVYSKSKKNQIKIIIINESLIKFNKKYKKKIYYKNSRYIGKLKKENFFKKYLKKKKEFIKNAISGMIKNNKIKKKLIKKIKFLKDINLLKKIKTKILYF